MPAPHPVPTLSSFTDLAALWQLYDEGEPHSKRPAVCAELEAQLRSDWRNQESNERWSDISRPADEVRKRAEGGHTIPVPIIKQMGPERLSQEHKA
ncbi:hypothetical protein WJX74_009577 [Apatococcus lobatus]|uniref:Uncharacterized protein n=2 Tax=Apatococcus TaxID=904362 RepID=A0AAW1SDI2_9CHLO